MAQVVISIYHHTKFQNDILKTVDSAKRQKWWSSRVKTDALPWCTASWCGWSPGWCHGIRPQPAGGDSCWCHRSRRMCRSSRLPLQSQGNLNRIYTYLSLTDSDVLLSAAQSHSNFSTNKRLFFSVPPERFSVYTVYFLLSAAELLWSSNTFQMAR